MTSSLAPSLDPDVGPLLNRLLTTHGLPLLSDSARLQSLLASRLPQGRLEVGLVIQALHSAIPSALLQPNRDGALAQAARLADQLAHDHAMVPEAARWAVHTWQVALGLMPPSAETNAAPTAVILSGPANSSLPSRPTTAEPVLLQAEVVRPPVRAPVARPGAAQLPNGRKRWIAAAAGAAVVAAGAAAFQLTRPSLRLDDIQAPKAIIGDGRSQNLALQYQARNTQPTTLEIRHVSGGGPWQPSVWTTSVNPTAQTKTVLEAAAPAQLVREPTQATFAFTLLDHDGRRSEPLERTLTFLPPVVITDARVLSTPRPGQPYTVRLDYRKGAGDIVKVTRRETDAGATGNSIAQDIPVELKQPSGSFDVRLDAPKTQRRTTLEFTMEDSLGARSAAVPLVIDVAAAPQSSGPATVIHVSQIRGTTGVGAVAGGVTGLALGNRVGRGNGRAVATVLGGIAGAVAGHQVEQQVRGTALWETQVRFDDGNTRTLRHAEAPSWQTGSRVVVRDGAILR